jgi:dTDP-4-dehydrorhamnose 3,5-epimerase
MGKLVRTVKGHMVDLILDIRKNSPTFGKAIAYDMPVSLDFESESEWIWVPVGCAHGNFFKEVTVIEYLCSGEYSQGNEASISPAANDIDWSLCEPKLYEELTALLADDGILSDKDKQGLTLRQWESKKESENFIYGEC